MSAQPRETMKLGFIGWRVEVEEVRKERIGFVGRDFLPIPPFE
jgi:hypothetical protein